MNRKISGSQMAEVSLIKYDSKISYGNNSGNNNDNSNNVNI